MRPESQNACRRKAFDVIPPVVDDGTFVGALLEPEAPASGAVTPLANAWVTVVLNRER